MLIGFGMDGLMTLGAWDSFILIGLRMSGDSESIPLCFSLFCFVYKECLRLNTLFAGENGAFMIGGVSSLNEKTFLWMMMHDYIDYDEWRWWYA